MATSTSASATATSSSICTASPLAAAPDPIVGSWKLQTIFIVIAAVCFGITTLASIAFVGWHLKNLGNSREQAISMRIGLTPFFFSLFALISVISYPASIYLTEPAKLWESFAVCAVFELFVLFMASDEQRHSNKQLLSEIRPARFTNREVRMACIRIYQFPVISLIKMILTMVFAATQCRTSTAHQDSQIALQVIGTLSTVLAVFIIIRFYRACREELKAKKCVSKLIALKSIVGIIVLQMLIFLGIDSQDSIVAGTSTISNADIEEGIPNLLICVEMAIFPFLMFWAYPSTPYKQEQMATPNGAPNNLSKMAAFIRVFDFRDILDGILLMLATITSLFNPTSSLGQQGIKDVDESELEPQDKRGSSSDGSSVPPSRKSNPFSDPQRPDYRQADAQRPNYQQAEAQRPDYNQAQAQRPAY